MIRHSSLALLVLAVVGAAACAQRKEPPSGTPATTAPLRSDAEIRELDIEYFSARAQRDPTGALDLAHLGSLYLARGRETGDPRDAILAEETARQSLRNRSRSNAGASSVLGSALLAQHRFDEALGIAITARNSDPENPGLRAAVADIQMELGQYDSARVSFATLRTQPVNLAVAPRLARWAEIEGRTDDARKLLRATLIAAQKATIPREQMGWYWLRVGDVELRSGHPAAADSAYHQGLAAHPNDYRLYSALAHSAALQRKWREALEYGEKTIGITLDPATLGTLSDAWAALGDTAKSAEYAHVLDVAVLKQPGAYHRAWSLFLLDHNRHVGTVARKIRDELKTRKDIYAYDLLAWSLLKQGRAPEARQAMAVALSEHTQDAQMFYHAGMIERALGDAANSRRMLARALAVNPYFHPTQPAVARAMLARGQPAGTQ